MENYEYDNSVYGEIDQRIQKELLLIADKEQDDYTLKVLQTIHKEGASFNDVADTFSRIKRLANAMEIVMDNWCDYDVDPSIPVKYTRRWEISLLLDTDIDPDKTDWVKSLMKKSIILPTIERDRKLAYEINGKTRANYVYVELPESAITDPPKFEKEQLQSHTDSEILRYLLIHNTPEHEITKEMIEEK